MPRIEDIVDDYLQSTEELHYEGSPLLGVQESHKVHHDRQRLSEKLIEEIRTVRKMSDEEADWTLDIVGQDT